MVEQIKELTIYRCVNGDEVAAIEDGAGNINLWTEAEFSESAKPSMWYDPLTGRIGIGGISTSAGALEDTGRTLVTCDVCGVMVWQADSTPEVNDDDAWARMALQHKEDCEWILTRAFRI